MRLPLTGYWSTNEEAACVGKYEGDSVAFLD